MTKRKQTILNVALPVPLRRHFDYLANENTPPQSLMPGARIKVPFGKSKTYTGLLLNTSPGSEYPRDKLKQALEPVDQDPLFDSTHMQLLDWASNYYHYPIGETCFSTMPVALKRGKPAKKKSAYTWELTDLGKQCSAEEFTRAPKQLQVLNRLRSCLETGQSFTPEETQWHSVLKSLEKKRIVRKKETVPSIEEQQVKAGRVTLNPDQANAVSRIKQGLGRDGRYLLFGITGSGKTEVYLEVMRDVISRGMQVLVLVPEIGLTPQLIQRIDESIGVRMAVLHSSMSDGERLQGWLEARDGDVSIVLGTRSAVWTPLKNPGLIIVDEEHDLSYKQQDGFRYSARDVAVMRGKLSATPVVLGSATPSMESFQNVSRGNFEVLTLASRAGEAQRPEIVLIDMRADQMRGALSNKLVREISQELEKKHQVLLFLNQRGFSPVIMCHTCGWVAKCNRCDTHMIYHKTENKYSCHHCGRESAIRNKCPDCDAEELLQVGHGTERLNETLSELFPDARILRIDRDSTRRRHAMKEMLETINAGEADILIGTQMLAKGHHFSKLTLVGIIDSDRGLFSPDFRGSERMMQLFLQVSGRAGREDKQGKVLVQTHYPGHPLIQAMLNQDYNEYSGLILDERRETNLPPFSYLTILRAEAFSMDTVTGFLTDARDLLSGNHGLSIHGPLPAIMEKRAGRTRYQLIIQSNDRNMMKKTLEPWSKKLETLASAGKVRWSIDVDPQDMN